MPVAERRILSLKCVNAAGGETDLLLLKWPATGSAYHLALPCRVCPQGVILAIPGGTIPQEILDEGDDLESMIGPSREVTIRRQEGSEADLLTVLLVEMLLSVRNQLEFRTPRSRRRIRGFVEDDVNALPDFAELNQEIEAWLESGGERLEEYFTAEGEADPPGEAENPATQAILLQLAEIQSSMDRRFTALEGRARVLDQDQRTGASQAKTMAHVPAGALPSGSDARRQQMEAALEPARSQVNRPPRRIPDEPGKETAIDLEELPGVDEKVSVDDMMKMALLKMMQQQQGKAVKKKKRLPGLPSLDADSESDDEDSHMDWSSSSRGGRGINAVERLWGAMRAHPEAYQERMESRMLKAVEASEMVPTIPLQFAKSCPVGKSRTAGFCLQGFAQVHKSLLENRPKQARLQVLRMMAALEQFLIDESWTVASRLTGMEEPPWGHWATQDLPALRKQYVYTRLAESTWIGALINELKEEEWLSKKRGNLGKGNSKGGKSDGKPDKDASG